jgi:hypothetical protein
MVGRLWGPCAQVVGPVDGWEVVIQPDLPGAPPANGRRCQALDPVDEASPPAPNLILAYGLLTARPGCRNISRPASESRGQAVTAGCHVATDLA